MKENSSCIKPPEYYIGIDWRIAETIGEESIISGCGYYKTNHSYSWECYEYDQKASFCIYVAKMLTESSYVASVLLGKDQIWKTGYYVYFFFVPEAGELKTAKTFDVNTRTFKGGDSTAINDNSRIMVGGQNEDRNNHDDNIMLYFLWNLKHYQTSFTKHGIFFL